LTKEAKTYRWTLLVLKGLLFAAAIVFVYYKVFHAKDTNVVRLEWQKLAATPSSTLLLLLAVLLMPINWGLDALKWKLLLKNTESISLGLSLKATFAGAAVSFLLPNRVGGFLGRMLYLKQENRAIGAFATVYANLFQLLVTLIVGAIATLFMMQNGWFVLPIQPMLLYVLFGLAALAAFAVIYMLQKPAWMVWLTSKLPYIKKWADQAAALQEYNFATKANVALLSVLRYVVFAVQFALVLTFYEVELSAVELAVGIAVCWLVVAIVPSFVLGNLGIRETAVLVVFAFAQTSDATLLAASLTIWLINLVLPAGIGGLFLMKRGGERT